MFKIGQLIIIGGPCCAGKTALIKKMQEGRYPHLREQLGLAVPHWWLYVDVFMLAKMHGPSIERLVVHYDFSTHYNRHKNRFDYLHQLIGNSNSTIVLTLCVSPKTLVRRMTLRFIKEFVLLLHKPKAHKEQTRRCRRMWKMRKIYKDDFAVFTLYERWFSYTNEFGVASHWMLDFNQANIVMAHPYETDRVGLFTGGKKVINS